MLITQKYGTNANTIREDDGQKRLDLNHVRNLTDLVHKHTRTTNKRAILVVSGAKALGLDQLKYHGIKLDPSLSKQLRDQVISGTGQADLIGAFREAFRRHNRLISPILATINDLETSERIREILTATTRAGIIPVCNANDIFTYDELGKIRVHADNDELARRMAVISGSEQLHYGTNTKGVYYGDPSNEDSRLISHISASEINDELITELDYGISNGGTGGIGSKLKQAKIAIDDGVKKVLIFNGKSSADIDAALRGEDIGTVITA